MQEKTNLEDSILKDTMSKSQAEKGKDGKSKGAPAKSGADDVFRVPSKEFESPSKKEPKKDQPQQIPDAKIIEDLQTKYKSEIQDLKSKNDLLQQDLLSKSEEVLAFQ